MVEIRPSPIHGNGLFATRDYSAGDIIVSRLHITHLQDCINASATLDNISGNASYAEFFRTITTYNVKAMKQANVTRLERYDHEFQILCGDLVAIVDIKNDEELLDTYPALVWLKKQGQSANADQYIYDLFKKGHPLLAPNAGVSQQVAANYAARSFSNIIYLGAIKENNLLCQNLIRPFVEQYLRRQCA